MPIGSNDEAITTSGFNIIRKYYIKLGLVLVIKQEKKINNLPYIKDFKDIYT